MASSGRGKSLTLPAWMTAANNLSTNIGTTTTTTQTPIQTPIPISLHVPPSIAHFPTSIPVQTMIGIQKPNLLPSNALHNNLVPGLMNPVTSFNKPPWIPPNQMQQPPMMNMSNDYGRPVPFNGGFAMNNILPPRVAPPPVKPLVALDPNNDVSAWSEHNTADGRKYWYNRITANSTYEKPFVLKTPEERSIPPCEWKEYLTSEGKKYYSNGKDSLWTMPEEFRIWKEKVEIATSKKTPAATIAAPLNGSVSVAVLTPTLESSSKTNESMQVSVQEKPILAPEVLSRNQQQKVAKQAEVEEPLPVYNSKEEAKAAFISLLDDKQISSTLKINQVQDLCQSDRRWNALKSIGEKKQELAEYQTKKLKQEKDLQRAKEKKNRDSFLLMLAERIEIDCRTRWRDAIEFLQTDSRYKNVEDAREREELFDDFVMELAKKEKEDLTNARNNALKKLNILFESLKENERINRKSVWPDLKSELLLSAENDNELKVLKEGDMRRAFLDFVDDLETAYRQAKKIKRNQQQLVLDQLLATFKIHLNNIIRESNDIKANTRWKDFQQNKLISEDSTYLDICKLLNDKELDLHGDVGSIFYNIQKTYIDEQRSDKEAIMNAIDSHYLNVTLETSFNDFRLLVLKLAGMIETSEGKLQLEEEEEGEDLSLLPPTKHSMRDKKSIILYLRLMLTQRPTALNQIFKMIQEEMKAVQDDGQKIMKKRFDRFHNLLSQKFYRSDHAGIPFDEVKEILEREREYQDLPKDQRKPLYNKYMDELGRRFEIKHKSMRSLIDENDTNIALETNSLSGDSEMGKKSKKDKKKRKHKDSDKDEKKEKKRKSL